MEYMIILLIIVSFLVLYMYYEAINVIVREHIVHCKTGKKSNCRILFISDIHRRAIRKSFVKKMQNKVDFIILGGDIAEKGVPIQRIEYNIRNLSKLGTIFFVWGNNDREIGESHWLQIFAKYEVKALSNSSFYIEEGHFYLAAIDDKTSGKANIQKAFEHIPANTKTIFISHTPDIVNKVIDMYKPFLTLSGHTHGGQIRFWKWGLHEKGSFSSYNDTMKLISNGYGTTYIPFRLGAPAECHIVHVMCS